jgi:hypothetical protein
VRPRTVILTSVVLSVLASAVTTMLLAPGRAPAPRTVSTERVAPAATDMARDPAAAAAAPALEERVRRIEVRLGAPGVAAPPRPKGEALQALLAITQGERQIAIEDSLEELSTLGNDVVPDIVARLKSGRDQDWGGGFSFGGNKMQGYPRLRTLMIDVLRQIGTPEAQEGLLDVLRGSEDPLDYRDVLLLYGTTTDERMVRGISALVPDAMRLAKGQERGLTMDYVNQWISRHGLKETTDSLVEIARESFTSGAAWDGGTFGTLIALAPERAFDLTRELREKNGDSAVLRAVTSVSNARSQAPLAQVARYYELVLSLEPTESTRIALYAWLPSRPCRNIEAKDARVADAKVLVDFLAKRLRDETSPKAKEFLAQRIALLEKEIKEQG